jgi:hypothetical protein
MRHLLGAEIILIGNLGINRKDRKRRGVFEERLKGLLPLPRGFLQDRRLWINKWVYLRVL